MRTDTSDFSTQYAKFMAYHLRHGKGDRLKRLKQGLGVAEREFLEKVWWPMYGHFEWLHPEFQVLDYKDGFRYIDFAYIKSSFRVAIEIDGYGPHSRDITQAQFWDDLQRQNHLVIDGWLLLRFPYIAVASHPRECQRTIQQLLGIWEGNLAAMDELTVWQREAFRVALRSPGPITPSDVCKSLHVGNELARNTLHQLVDARWLVPVGGSTRIRRYMLHPTRRHVRI